MTSGYPLYKKSYMSAALQQRDPIGFRSNKGAHYIDYPIHLPGEHTTQQAHYTQAIMAPNPLVIALQHDSNKVFSKPLYASLVYAYDGKPTYATGELDYLRADAQGREFTDWLID